MKVQQRIDELFNRVIDGTGTEAEWTELLTLVNGVSENDEITLAIPLRELWQQAGQLNRERASASLDKEKLYRAVTQGTVIPQNLPMVKPKRSIWYRYAVAALIIGLLLLGGWWYANDSSDSKKNTQDITKSPLLVPPGMDRAILTLANGQQVILDSTSTAAIGTQGSADVVNKAGTLQYRSSSTKATAIIYNTVSTAKANQYQVVLSDGSKVWLNALSSIKFPTAFTGKQRIVEITGEAFFDIAKDKRRPFHVRSGQTDIEVLGTSFNLNTYTDEEVIKTSLLEGKVKITSAGKNGVVNAGQQAIIQKDKELQISNGNVELAAAWKNGYFQFDQATVPVLMRQIGRWYDIEIKYQGKIPQRSFKGKIQRSLPLSSVLNLLEKGGLHFTLQRKILTVHEK